MTEFRALEPAVDPNNRMLFLLDWEVTMKCNLDCDYCFRGLHGGHDNSTAHPPLNECLKAIDFMYEYADTMLQNRMPNLKTVVLNVYGGEALNHPDIVEILTQARERYKPYQDRWNLIITNTTNLIVPKHKFEKIVDLVDEFSVSWHTNNTNKQKQQFRENVLHIKSKNRRVKCIILMHPTFFDDAQAQINWCVENGIRYLPKQLDQPTPNESTFKYSQQQVVWFKNLYNKETFVSLDSDGNVDLADKGRTCCGGRSFCVDQNYRDRQKFVSNKFDGWYCSVDKFFLFVKQLTKEVYVNKDCKMNYQGEVGPIGTLDDTRSIIAQVNKTPTIKCAKLRCVCGLCAPKAADLDTYNSIIKKYRL